MSYVRHATDINKNYTGVQNIRIQRQYFTVQDPQRLVLSDLPVKVSILVKQDTQAINPAEAYTDAEWDRLEPDFRSELETQYVLNNPGLMAQMQDRE